MFRKIKTFIKEKRYKYNPYVIEFIKTRDLKTRTSKVVWLVIDVCFTGFLIMYCLTNRNWLSYGLTVAVGLRLIKDVVLIFKTPYKELRQEW